MKIAIVRGDFASPWELQNFEGLLGRNKVSLFTGYYPVAALTNTWNANRVSLISPVDINFGKISRIKMGIANRLFGDAHFLFNLENNLVGYDISHVAETYYGYTQQAISAKKSGNVKKIVSTVWDNIPHNNESIDHRKEFKQNSFNNVDLFLATTTGARDALIAEGCRKDKIRVMYPGVDLKKFYSIKKHNKHLKLLFVARFEPEKGLPLLLDIFKNYREDLKEVGLSIVGTGSLENYTRTFIAENRLTNITLLGKVDYGKMPELFRKSDLLVHPAIGNKSWVEQFGMVLVEAMASGIPILGVNRGSIKEVVGNAGIVVAPDFFGKTLVKTIKNRGLLLKLASRARTRAKNNFDSRLYSGKLEEVYKDLIKQ